jgi:aconitate hydratase
VVGYGCTTCIGNSGPLPTDVSKSIEEHGLVAVSVLSGNRNFEGRISPEVRANYLMSPPLVVAYALAGHIGHNFDTDPLGHDKDGQPVFLKDIWPTQKEVRRRWRRRSIRRCSGTQYSDGERMAMRTGRPEVSEWRYVWMGAGFDVHPQGSVLRWHAGDACAGEGHSWGARAGGAGRFGDDGPYFAGGFDQAEWACGQVPDRAWSEASDFNSYGSRRGNHEVMVRGTFANVRLRNKLAPGTEGGVTRLLPEDIPMSIYDASWSMRSAARRWRFWRARSMARGRRATGRRRGRGCWGFAS